MGEVIYLREFANARERAARRASTHRDLDAAVAVMRDNLAAVAERLRCAPAQEQPELLDRVEKLTAMIRYGMRMLRATPESDGSAANGARV
jgi:anti-sigma-K factor RskA